MEEKRKNDEAAIRDFLAERMDQLPQLISNLEDVLREIRSDEQAFFAIAPQDGGPTALALIRRVLNKRRLRGLNSLSQIELINTEFPLLKTGKGGFQPSADILARSCRDGRLFVIEVKQLMETERQAVTELSAYSHGLNIRLWNLARSDYAWVPICTEWRTTVRAGFANEAIWNHRPVLPMRCRVTKEHNGSLTGVALELLSLVEDVPEPLALSQFAWASFDTMTFELSRMPSAPRTIVDFMASTAARMGFSGCVLYGESTAGNSFPFPYVYAISVHNPFSAARLAAQLKLVCSDKDSGGEIEMRKHVKDNLWDWHDIDFMTMESVAEPSFTREIADDIEAEGRFEEAQTLRADASKDYLSIRNLAESSLERTTELFEEIRAHLSLFCKFEVRMPILKTIRDGGGVPITLKHISYFGLLQDVVYERVLWESNTRKNEQRSADDLAKFDALTAIGDPEYFFEFMSLMNFEHNSQTQ